MESNSRIQNIRPRLVVSKHLADMKAGNVLDLGCGKGNEALYMAEQGFQVTGVDTDTTALSELKERAEALGLIKNIRLINEHVVSFAKHTDKSTVFDNIFSFLTLHFLPKEQAYFMYDWIQKHTAPGGLNIMRDFMDSGEFNTKEFYDAQLFLKARELKEMYKDWEVLHYIEVETRTRAGDLQMVAEIVARKSDRLT